MLIPALAAVLALQTAADAPAAPTGKWTVEYADSMCVLSRSYGAGPTARILALRPFPLSTSTEVVLFVPRVADRSGPATLRLLPGGAPAKGDYRRVALPDSPWSVVTMTYEGEALAALDRAGSIALEAGGTTHHLATPGIAGAARALRTCQADLLKSWDVDAQELADGRVRPKPKGDIGVYFGPNAYPPDALQARAQGRVVTVIKVAADGSQVACKVVQSAHPSLDAATCLIARKRIRFDPGRDADGAARDAHFVLPVRWTIAF